MLLAMLVLYTLEKSTSVKPAAKQTERSPPPQSECKRFYTESSPTFPNFICSFIAFLRKSHSMNLTAGFSPFQVPVEMASSHPRRLSHGKGSSAFIKSHSRTPSPSPILLRSPGHQVSPGGSFGARGNSAMGLPAYSQSYTWSFHFFPCFSSVSRSCATSAFRFVVPLYKTQSYYSPWTSQGPLCPPKYMGISGILPQPSCFENLKRSKVASFCGSE